MRGRHDDRLGAQRPGLPPVHRGAHAPPLGLVAAGEHHAPADDHRAAAQPRRIALLDRRVERIEIGMQDGGLAVHEHMFASSPDTTEAATVAAQKCRWRGIASRHDRNRHVLRHRARLPGAPQGRRVLQRGARCPHRARGVRLGAARADRAAWCWPSSSRPITCRRSGRAPSTRSRCTSISTSPISTPPRRPVVALGARKHEHQPGKTFRVFLDPAGHPFCLCQA